MSPRIFVNPYNFIPFGSAIEERRKSREEVYRGKEQLVSGWLTVELETKTPLIIPDGAHPQYYDFKNDRYIKNPDSKQEKELHKEYKFFRIPGKNGEKCPVIPGSELRGMIRSTYEAATDSCVAFLLNDKPISRRVPVFGSLQKRGLLAYEETTAGSGVRQWVLYSTYADDRIDVDVAEEKKVKILKYKDGRKVEEKNGEFIEDRGWLQYNIPVNTKDDYHIVYLKPREKIYTWKDDEPYRFLNSALIDRPKMKNPNEIPNKNLKEALEKAKKGGDNQIPVYYFIVQRDEKELVYLSNSSIGRIAQKRKWEEIMGVHAPCSSTDQLCPACLLFGTTKGKGMKGHVRVTDAVLKTAQATEKHTLQILGEPRTSAFEFYLRKPQGNAVTYWNFDFYGEKVTNKKGDDHTEYQDLGQATPRGRKMYWHGPVARDDSKGKMNSTMEALKGSFEFKVYFDEITENQLQELIWVITLGENDKESEKQHKLGHAKPLGYGSVKLVVTEKTVRRIAAEGEKMAVVLEEKKGVGSISVIQPEEGKNFDQKAVKNLLIMCDTKSVPDDFPIMYPRELDKNKNEFIYTWFAQNRKNADSVKILPEPNEIKDKKKALRGQWNDKEDKNQKVNEGVYRVRVVSEGRQAKNINYWEYDIEVLNAPKFQKCRCTMTAHKKIKVKKGEECEAKLFKGTKFDIIKA